MAEKPLRVLFDATRLSTRGALQPTGIDRVDLAYVNTLSVTPGIDLQLLRFGLLGPALLSPRAREELLARWRASPVVQPGFEALLCWLESPPGTLAPRRETTVSSFLARRAVNRALSAVEFPLQATRLEALMASAGPGVYLNTSHGQLYRRGVARWLTRHRLPSVFFVHDLIPLEFPEFNRAGEPQRHARRLHTIATQASCILVNSQATRVALLRHLAAHGLPTPPIEVLPLGTQPMAAQPAAPIAPRVPYFVILSTIEPRKNHRLLLLAWERLVETEGDAAPRLLLIGRRGWENQTVFKLLDRLSGASHHVAECSGLDDAALVRVLAGARALLSPSFAEGFGLPVTEALALGTPVLASDLPAHREVAAGRAELLDPRDAGAWLRAIVEHAAEPSPRNAAQRKLAAGFLAPDWGTHFTGALATLRAAAVGGALAALTACGSYLPSAGPARSDIRSESDARDKAFVLVDVSQSTLTALQQRPVQGFVASFGREGAAPELTLGTGDGVSVTIWEAGTQPLFAAAGAGQPGSARGTTLPEQIVDRDGSISIPYAGRIKVAGRTLGEVQAAIEQALVGKTARPQVVATLTRNVSNAVTVVGEGAAGGRVALSPRGDRLLDVLAAAGRAPSFETRVTLQRGDARVSLPLSAVLNDPAENVLLHPGDLLVVTRQAETFTAFGATGRNAQIPFDTARVNLVEAVAKAGGLQDARADPQGVFVFRREPGELAAKLAQGGAPAGASVPVVYQVDLTRAGGYFLAHEFEVRDGDVLYIASAPANELTKFLQLLGLATQPAANGAIIENAVRK